MLWEEFVGDGLVQEKGGFEGKKKKHR